MRDAQIHGYETATDTWHPIAVDANGKVKIKKG